MAVSIVLPPPTATIASKSPRATKSDASWKLRSVGSTETLSKTSYPMPASSSEAITVRPVGNSTNAGSITTTAFSIDMSARSMPTSDVVPGPKRMFEADIWNAVSLSLIFGPLAA